jgi:hypothetical protein
MSCCGGRRRAHKAWLQSRPVRLRYLGDEAAEVTGRITGRRYEFTVEEREREVDAQDALGLLQSGGFRVVNAGAVKVR